MPRTKKGGTYKWCPECEDITICKAKNPGGNQRRYMANGPDIHLFRRSLSCKNCGNEWLSAEVEHKFLVELLELREALNDLKMNALKFQEESENAKATLTKLTESLEVLKALD